MWATGIAFPKFTEREITAKNKAISYMEDLNASSRKNESSSASHGKVLQTISIQKYFTNILRLTLSLSSLFCSSLFSGNSAHMWKSNVRSRNSLYRREQFARFPALRGSFDFLQEGSVSRLFSPANVDSAHPPMLAVLLACVMAFCLFLWSSGSPLANAPAALTPAPVFDRMASAAPAFERLFALSLFAAPSSRFGSLLGADPSSPGTVNGRVSYEGTPKKLKPIDMSAEPNCAKFYNTPPMPEISLTGGDNSLQNVIVYVSAGASDENFTGPVVHLNQRGCRYTPHVVAVQNDDTVTHSVHPLAHVNTEWNRSQPPGTPPVVIRYTQPEFIRVKCELHPWMRGVLAVFKNSHHAVTDSTGSFTLPELPPGKYTITAWHEVYGTQSKEITIAPGQNAELNFVFKVTPY
jgi:Carboxypeptidase regulatory-like domain